MDVICFCTTFPAMGWKWTLRDPYPIHLNHKQIWESHYIPHFYKIFDAIVFPLHQMIFDKKTPRFSQEAATDLLLLASILLKSGSPILDFW